MNQSARYRSDVDEEVRQQDSQEEKAPILGGWPLWNDEHTKIIGWHAVDGTETFFEDEGQDV